MTEQTLQAGFRLNEFVVEPTAGEITGPEGTHHLQPKAIDVLVCLARKSGEVVERDSILEEVWGGRPVADEALTRCIHDIRQALGDNRQKPAYVQTVPRRGYRLLVAPEPLSESGTDKSSQEEGIDQIPFGFRRRVAVVIGSTIAVFVAAILYYALSPPTSSFAFNAHDTAIVTTFNNHTDDNLLGDALRQAFRVALGQSRYVQVLSDQEVQDTRKRMGADVDMPVGREVGAEIAIREGAKVLIAGTIGRAGEQYTLSAEIVDPGSGRTVYSISSIAKDANHILSSLQSVTEAIRGELGESLDAIDENNMPLERVTTNNLDALKSYSMAIQKMVSGENEAAFGFFENAIEQDPEFALAHAKLGTLCRSLGKDAVITFNHYQVAASLEERLTEKEKLYVQGAMAWFEDPAKMRARWAMMAAKYPEEAGAHHNLGIVAWNYENDFAQAKAAHDIAANMSHPLRYGSLLYLGYANMGLGHYEEAIANFEESYAIENNPVGSALAEGYIVVGRYTDAEQFLAKSTKNPSPPFRRWAKGKQLALYVDRGQFTDATALSMEIEDMAGTQGSTVGVSNAKMARLALLERLADRTDFKAQTISLIKAESAHLTQDRNRLGFDPAVRVAMAAKLAARHGLVNEAEQAESDIEVSGKAQGFPIAENYLRILRSEILLYKGNSSAAIAVLQEVVAEIDLWQAHESLARAYEKDDQIDAAIQEYQWLGTHRGRAFAEWNDDFFGKELAIIDYALANYHLGRLYTIKKNFPLARERLESFVRHWDEADDDIETLIDARNRLAKL